MRRAALALLIAGALGAQQPTSYRGSAEGWGPFASNHHLHFFAGALIGSAAYLEAEREGYGDPGNPHGWKRNLPPRVHALFWGVVIGLVKENYDRKHGGRPEWGDVAYTALGSWSITIPLYRTAPSRRTYATAPKLTEP